MLPNGAEYNQTSINIGELDVGYIEVGEPFDQDYAKTEEEKKEDSEDAQQPNEDRIEVFSLVEPPTKHIWFDSAAGSIFLDLVDLFAAASEDQLTFNVKIVLTDTNFFPRSSTYLLTIVVPHTPLESVD